MKKLILVTSFTLSLSSLAQQNIDIAPRLNERNQLNILTQDPVVKSYLFDQQISQRLSQWLAHDKIRSYVVNCQTSLRAHIRSPKILGALCYLLRQDDLEKRNGSLKILERYLLENELALKEISEDPRYSPLERNEAKKLYESYASTSATGEELKGCFSSPLKYDYSRDPNYEFSPFESTRQCLVRKFSFLSENIAKKFNHHPGHLISETGWVAGNKVEYLTWNDVSEETRLKIHKTLDLVPSLYPLSGKGSLKEMLKVEHDEVFTEEEGFVPAEQHYAWSQKRGIFFEIFKAVSQAKESIFTDIFFLGGSTGAALAKHLVKLVETKPGLKVFILRDQLNHFGHEKSMLPIFNFLLAYSLKNPDKLVILPAVISEHKSGLPGFIAPLITENFLLGTGIQDHLQLYGEAKSDHSKVFVIDGKSKSPVAFVGSKNLTDASGPFCYDEVAKVTGPAAAIVLDDYYLDMKFALSKVDYTKKPYQLSGYDPYLVHLAKNGWSSAFHKASDTPQQMIANVLKPFDLLNRNSEMEGSVSSLSLPSQGSALIRNGMTNVDSTRTNLVDQVVQAIKFAQSKIIIKDQFIFDRNVVLALIEAKNKAKEEQRNLEVKLILEPLALTNPKGMPNLLYLDRLKEVGIEIKWMQTYPFKPFVDGSYKNMSEEQIHALHDISQELHQKTISVDGKFVISGSANKDQTTMYGAFREAQLDIYDPIAVKVHDDVFYEYWNNPQLTHPFTGFNFEVPENFKGPDGKTLSPQEFIVTVRNILSILYDWAVVR